MRPANMRLTHGLRPVRVSHIRDGLSLSVASVECVEDVLTDPWNVRETGGGMDAPDALPTGSIKAFFTDSGDHQYTLCFGFCQRTTTR